MNALISCKVKFALSKGSLEASTFSLLERAGFRIVGQERSYRPKIDDPDICLKVLRPQEIPIHVAEGFYDLGITGLDWMEETEAEVEVLSHLDYGRVNLVFALPKEWGYENLTQMITDYHERRNVLRIATEYLNLASKFLLSNEIYRKLYGESRPTVVTPWWKLKGNDMVKIFLSFGATEAKPPEEVDLILDNAVTGLTLDQNNLRVLETVGSSEAVLIANRESLKDDTKMEKILDIKTLLDGVVSAEKKVHIFMNVKEENLQSLLSVLPGLKSPTISPLSEEGWYAVNTVIDRADFLRIISTIRKLAQGLVIYDPKQVLLLGGESSGNS